MPTLYLTEDRALVRRDTEDCLLVQVPEQRGENGTVLAAAYKKRIPLIKVHDVVVMGEVTMTTSACTCSWKRILKSTFSHILAHSKVVSRLSFPKTRCYVWPSIVHITTW